MKRRQLGHAGLGVSIVARFSLKLMLKTGILNPAINSLLSRVRHTNMLVISDRGFPFWPMIETVDISLIDGVPTVLQAVEAIRANFVVGKAFMAEEFLANNDVAVRAKFAQALEGVPITYEPHEAKFKPRVPQAIGLIRTGDNTQYANMILVSA
jgi:D-ribose pyranase